MILLSKFHVFHNNSSALFAKHLFLCRFICKKKIVTLSNNCFSSISLYKLGPLPLSLKCHRQLRRLTLYFAKREALITVPSEGKTRQPICRRQANIRHNRRFPIKRGSGAAHDDRERSFKVNTPLVNLPNTIA